MFERIQPGAFDKAVTRDDVRALQNHDPRLVLGRTAAKTLSLELTSEGLAYRIVTPNTTAGRDTVESVRRSDIDGSSFAFSVVRGGVEWTQETVEVNGVSVTLEIRNIRDVVLYDVGPVTYPAYAATAAGTRSPGVFLMGARANGSAELEDLRAELQEHVQRTRIAPASAARARRLRIAEAG